MSEESSTVPLIVIGAATGFALASVLASRGAAERTLTAPSPRRSGLPPFRLNLGRPAPEDVRAIVANGWASIRGTGANRRLHRALDFGFAIGTPILAVESGRVTHVHDQDTANGGRWIAILHESGISSRYFHLSRIHVRTGQQVQRGDQIALSGESGSHGVPHLHLDLRAPASMLAAIEEAIGRPRSGWGPEMKPFGHSIPGEPFVLVDAYRSTVRTDATAQGIPLRDPTLPRNAAPKLVYRPVGDPGDPYPDWIQDIRDKSGVYVIRERDADGDPIVVYVGQSSTGRLYETLTRHLQQWRRYKTFWKDQYGEGHDPGLTYDRAAVDVAVKITPASRALDEEARLIRKLKPRDNLLGQTDVPF